MSMDLGRVVRFTNITDEDFTHHYNADIQPLPFTVKARQSQLFPYDLGRHLAKHLARKIIIGNASSEALKNDRTLFGEKDEEVLINKILSDDFRQELAPELSEAERLRKRVEDLNANKPEEAPKTDRTRADVIAELEEKGIDFDKRLSMDKLEALLK